MQTPVLLFCVESPVSLPVWGGAPVWIEAQSWLRTGTWVGGRAGHMEKIRLLRLESPVWAKCWSCLSLLWGC